MAQLRAQATQVVVKHVHLFLQSRDRARHLLVLQRVLEAIAAVRRIHAFEIQVTAPLTRRLAIALDFPPARHNLVSAYP